MAITPGVQFGMEGPVMTGTWINPKTGHKFTVRDTFFQDNQFMVQTTDGQMLDYNTIQNYIQCNDNAGRAIEPTPDIVEHASTDIPREVADMVDTGSDMMIPEDTHLGNIYSDNSTKSPADALVQDPDMAMVDRVLKKHPEPTIVPQITWDVPQRQIETLIDILGIDPATVAKYYINKINKESVMMDLLKSVAEYIKNITTHKTAEVEKEPQEKTSEKPSTNPTRAKRTRK